MTRMGFRIPILVSILISGCVEPFSPGFPETSSSLLVVEGSITDAEGPYTVRLSRSFEISSGEDIPVSGAFMTLGEENGLVAPLIETSTGVYVSDGIRGNVGQRYRLSFTISENQYVSSWVRMRRSPPIDSVYWRLEDQETTDPEVPIAGVQFFVDTHGSEEDVNFYRWVWDETWEVSVNHSTFWEYLGNDMVKRLEETRNLCWFDLSPRTIDVLSTEGLGSNVVSEHPLLFVTNNVERFTRRYSLLIKQYALEEEEYSFWRNLGESNDRSAELFDKQPARVLGNIQNLTNPEETVLGYFWASGVSEKRVFVKSSDVLPELRRRPKCSLDTVLRGRNHDPRVFQRLDAGAIFYDFLRPAFGPGIIGYLLTNPNCSDCVFKGGKTERPDFWDD